MVQPVAQSLKWLSQQAINSELSESQKDLAQVIIVRAPALLWPQPPPAEKRRPYSRVRICKERLQALHEGRWTTLFQHSPHTPGRKRNTEPTPGCPDSLLWKRERSALLKAMQHHRVCTAWKRLHSLGLPEACELTVAKIAEKWSPQDDPLPDRQSGLTLTECLRQLIGHLSTAWVGEQPQHLQTLSTEHIAWRMVSIYKIVALKRNTAGAVRPIAMPTVWHKLAAHIQVQESGAVICSLTEPYQYALGASNPAHAVGDAMAARVCELEDPVVVQLDIANAYGGLKRHYIDKALRDCGHQPGLQEMQRWNATLHYGQTSVSPGTSTLLAASIGRRPHQYIPVRLGLHHVIQKWRSVIPSTTSILAYADDMTLITEAKDLYHVMARLEQELEAAGLALCRDKTQIWSPLDSEIPPGLDQTEA